jgi:sugar lactone lactonase YvrE
MSATAPPPTTTPTSTLTLSSATALCLHDAHATLGESPLAHGDSLVYVDIEGRAVHVLPSGRAAADGGNEATNPAHTFPTPAPVGSASPTTHPSLLLVSQPESVHLLDTRTGEVGPPLASIPADDAVPGTRFNDGKASPQGVWVGGRLHKEWRAGKRARVYALRFGNGNGGDGGDEGKKAEAALVPVLEEDEVGMANGMAWSKKGTLFFIADSADRCVRAFDADPATGIPLSGSGRVVVSTATLGGCVPDGLDIDEAGRLWVALAESGSIGVFEPAPADSKAGGEGVEVGRVRLPVTRVTACAWGRGEGEGAGRDTLLVTSREEKGEGASPAWGGLFGVRGTGGRGAVGGCGVVALPGA